MEILISVLLVAVAVEALTSIVLCEDSLFHTALWRKVQVKLEFEAKWYRDEYEILQSTDSKERKGFWKYLSKLSKCNYCISFWFSVGSCIYMFGLVTLLPLAILATWRLSHLFDAVYRYYLVRSFVTGDIEIEE